MSAEDLGKLISQVREQVERITGIPDAARIIINESHASSGYDDISTVYAYYTPEEKAAHGKHCEHWTEFGHKPETAPYRTHHEREFIAKIEAKNPGKFASYLISWSGSD